MGFLSVLFIFQRWRTRVLTQVTLMPTVGWRIRRTEGGAHSSLTQRCWSRQQQQNTPTGTTGLRQTANKSTVTKPPQRKCCVFFSLFFPHRSHCWFIIVFTPQHILDLKVLIVYFLYSCLFWKFFPTFNSCAKWRTAWNYDPHLNLKCFIPLQCEWRLQIKSLILYYSVNIYHKIIHFNIDGQRNCFHDSHHIYNYHGNQIGRLL